MATGRSHGIIVYSKGEPVGWCQYGCREELPRFDYVLRYVRPAPDVETVKLWRITCFVVDPKHRRSGVATAALKAALEAIRTEGGGLVEAYPIKRWGEDRKYLGTLSMFKREGFKVVSPWGRSNVVVRRTV